MGTTLTGTTPQDTYDSLIKVTDNGPLSATAKYLSDGLGNDSVLALSTARVGIGTTSLQAQLHIDGTTAESSFIMERDTVAANSVIGQIKFTNNNGTTTYGTLLGGRNAAGDGYSALGTGIGTNLYAVEGGNVGIGTSAPTAKLDIQEGAVRTFQSSLTAYKTYTKAAEFQFSSYQSVAGAPFTKTTDLVANADSGVPSEMRILVAAAGSNPAEIARFTANGLTFNGDTAAANALDDYEEGTWTMGIAFGGASVGVTSSSNTGTYTKVGRQVTVNGSIFLTNKGSSAGEAEITGLPFTIASGSSMFAGANLYFSSVTFANQFQAYGEPSTTTINLREITEAGVETALTDANFANDSIMIVSLTYFV